jgi:hypothetical protein
MRTPRAPTSTPRPTDRVARLTPADIACWVFKSSLPPDELAPGWPPGAPRSLTRCVRPSYRLQLMTADQPCLLWVSGRVDPGVHALGTLTGGPHEDDGGPVAPVRLTRLRHPLPRAALLTDPVARDAEVFRMPAGSNPSWLSADHFAAVLDRIGEPG